MSIFDDPTFAIRYEQVNEDMGRPYNHFASTSLTLAQVAPGSRVLDAACGTGISTTTIIDETVGANVVGFDSSEPLLRITQYKFGKSDNGLIELARTIKPYAEMKVNFTPVNIVEHLKKTGERYRGSQVKLFRCDAGNIEEIADDNFDVILASQFIHWPRKKDATAEKPNFEYERQVLQQFRSKLVDGGKLVFNTSGHDYHFDDDRLNKIHLMNHPFRIALRSALLHDLGINENPAKSYTFDKNEFERIMGENGFTIVKTKTSEINYNPNVFAALLIGNVEMDIFQKNNINMPTNERERLIRKAISYAMNQAAPEKHQVIETGIHIVAVKS